MEMIQALELLSGYTAGQWGMVTTRQAQMIGVYDVTLHRLKTAGLLEGVRRGVHAVTSADASDARAEQAVWLALHPEVAGWERPRLDPDGGVISHRSAARLHGVGELVNTRVEITVPRRRTMRDPNAWLHQAELTSADVTVLNGLPVTRPTRTICDLLDQHIDASHIATIIRQAVEGGQVQLDQLAETIKPYAQRYGAKPLTGAALLDLLLAQIGLSTQELSTRPSPEITWGQLKELTWSDLKNTGVTWGQLAEMSPEVAQRLRRATTTPNATIEPNDET